MTPPTMRFLFAVCVLSAVTLQADDASVARRIAEINTLWTTGKLVQAQEGSAALVAECPTDVAALRQLAGMQCSVGRIREAEATIERARVLAPNDAQVYVTIAFIFSVRHDRFRDWWPEAAAALRHATQLNPQSRDAWFDLAVAQAMRFPSDLPAARYAYSISLQLGSEHDFPFEEMIHWSP